MKLFLNTRFIIVSIVSTLSASQTTTVHAAGNLVFNPIAPCRILDTREGKGDFAGPIKELTKFSIQTNLSDYTPQGGSPAPCGLPAKDAAAVMLNVVAVSPPGPGNLRVYPYTSTDKLPDASTVNFVPGQDIANNTTVAQCIDCDADVSIFVASKADVIVDVVGYFNPPTPALDARCTVTPDKPTLDKFFYKLQLVGSQAGATATYNSPISMIMQVDAGKVIGTENSDVQLEAKTLVSGFIGTDTGVMKMTFSPTNKGELTFTNMMMSSDNTLICGEYSLSGFSKPDTGTFTMTKQ